MAGEQHRAGPAHELTLEERGGRVVQVVGRLVEEQRIRSAEQQCREGEPAALAARDLADPPGQRDVADTEAGEQLVAAGLDAPDLGALRRRECGGCRLTLNPSDLATIAAAPSDEVVRCEECSRILVRTGESGL